jgi:hypothetical protein
MGVDYYLANTTAAYRNVSAVIILRRLATNRLTSPTPQRRVEGLAQR